MTVFRITVTSDTVCPWCYVGARQLQRAQELHFQTHPDANDSFAVTYSPYQLNPDAPTGPGHSKDKRQYYVDKFGAQRTSMIQQSLFNVGAQLGIDFRFGGKTGNTRDSHRLVQLAKKHGNQVELKTVHGLFAAYFENERDITDYETLRSVAEEAGIPGDEFDRAIVHGDDGGKEVDDAVVRARLDGVSSVPDYLIQGKYRISGGQEALVFVRAFEKIKELELEPE
ncbi:DSBA oxidoreductase [Metarhizium album ARSEF 1941]|uniref:DSBA oxidoreductase n=1 Tax=Metarhizium album (strain ARSEF 1941) TaxID=1081103 RepID=A0A0B2WV29_METAS|nr:DSBA oxidoreductase [Metarhizium album ARSEF 1941]KHN97297.1 DSBA oxidoreductase [Metarhizium album ARSEF 1941]